MQFERLTEGQFGAIHRAPAPVFVGSTTLFVSLQRHSAALTIFIGLCHPHIDLFFAETGFFGLCLNLLNPLNPLNPLNSQPSSPPAR